MATVAVAHELVIPVSPDRAWAEIADPSTWAHWNVNHVGFSGEVPELAPGAAFSEQLQVRKAPAEVAWTVVDHTAPERLVLRGKGPLAMTVEHAYTVSVDGGGTLVRASLSLTAVALKPMVNALTKELDRNLPETLERLRDRLVAAPAPA